MRKSAWMTLPALAAGMLAFPAITASAAVISWDAGGDGLSTFAEANWVVTDDTGSAALNGLVGSDPPADFVNPNTTVEADMIVSGGSTAGGPAGAGGHVDLGSGLSLAVSDNATFNVRVNDGSNNRGIRGVSGGAAETLTISDNGSVTSQFLLNLSASMSGASTLRLGGGGVGTLNNSTVDLATDWTGSITWLNFNVAGSSIFGSITVGGAAAVEGVNVQVAPSGNNGSVLTLVPEPASLALVGVGGLCLLARRQK